MSPSTYKYREPLITKRGPKNPYEVVGPTDKDIELYIKDEISTDHEIVQQLVSENDETASLLGAVLREDMESKSDAWKARRLEEIHAMLYSDASELAEQEMTEGVA